MNLTYNKDLARSMDPVQIDYALKLMNSFPMPSFGSKAKKDEEARLKRHKERVAEHLARFSPERITQPMDIAGTPLDSML